MAAVSPDREIEIRIREGLVVEREVPPLLVIGPKAAATHRGGASLTLRSDGHDFGLKKSNGEPISSSRASARRTSVRSTVEPRE